MRVTLNFATKQEERIRKAFNGDGSLEAQMVQLVLNHVGQRELNTETVKLDKDMKDENDKLKAERDQKLQTHAQRISKELGL